MAGLPAPRTWLNRQNVDVEDLQEEIYEWNVNSALGLARVAGQMFSAAGERELRVLEPPTVPSVITHPGVEGASPGWTPQSEVTGGGGGGVIDSGYYRDGTSGSLTTPGQVYLQAGNIVTRATPITGGYTSITRMSFNLQRGSDERNNAPADFVSAGPLFDNVNVGDYILMESNQELGDLARFRITSIQRTQSSYNVTVESISHVGVWGAINRTWKFTTVARAIVDADDVFGIGAGSLAPITDDTLMVFTINDRFRVQKFGTAVSDKINKVNKSINDKFDGTNNKIVEFLRGITTGGIRTKNKDLTSILLLSASSSIQPSGITTDNTTMWIADSANDAIWAFRLSDLTRDPGKDLSQSLLRSANPGIIPVGITTDGITMWVISSNDRVWAFRLSDLTRDPSKDLSQSLLRSAIGTINPTGITTDNTTLWVLDKQNDAIWAFRLSDLTRDPGKDLSQSLLKSALTSIIPNGITTDGITMWVLHQSGTVYAFRLSNLTRDPYKDLTSQTIDNVTASSSLVGIATDGVTMWVADSSNDTLWAFAINFSLS